MDAAKILDLVARGITVVEAIVRAGNDALPAIVALKAVVVDKKTVTQADLDACEARLDALIDEFNVPLPPEGD